MANHLAVHAQMVDGKSIPEFGAVFGVEVSRTQFDVNAYLIRSSVSANILAPNDSLRLTIQFSNSRDVAYRGRVKVEMIHYGTRGRPGDIWVPEMFAVSRREVSSMVLDIARQGYTNVTIAPGVPKANGAYGFVVDIEGVGRQFITSCVRTFAFEPALIQYPSFCLDDDSNEVLERLGVHAIRHGIDYKPTTDPDFEQWYEEERRKMEAYQKSGIAVLVKMSAPSAFGRHQPLGMPRPWLDARGVMQNTKTDMAWLPSYDADFKKMVYRLACDFGWPRGPVNAFALWNEPWEGISISGWGADMIRYREIYTQMAEAVEEARAHAGVDVLVGGCSSTSNALDKLFADGSDEFLDRFDFCSIHYQGLSSSATIKKWVDRKSPRGRVKIWDTESWVANTDDRVAAVVSSNRAAGYDRAMGVYFGNIAHKVQQPFIDDGGSRRTTDVIHAWSVAASVGAVQHFVGERKFREILFKNGLPWVTVFDGLSGPEDGTLVVVGDIGEAFGANQVLFRTARGLRESAHEQELRREISRLDPRTALPLIDSLKDEIARYETLSGATLSFSDQHGKFRLYDFYGNLITPSDGVITVPLDGRGFFLRANGTPGSFDALVAAIRQAKTAGIEPLETIALDFTRPLNARPPLRLRLTNVLNRPVSGVLQVKLDNVRFKRTAVRLSFQPHETKDVQLEVLSASQAADNTYRLSLTFDAGGDGTATHEEQIHVNWISRRTVTVDGSLEEWKDVLPQVIRDGKASSSMTEAAWFPFKNFEKGMSTGVATGYLASDDRYFYFAAKIADDTPDPGMPRFEQYNGDESFYPDTVFVPYNAFHFGGAMKQEGTTFSIRWKGKLTAPMSEQYQFLVDTRQPVRMWLDDKLILDNDQATAPIPLQKGREYELRIEYMKDRGDGSVRLLWKNSSMPPALIAPEYFSHGIVGEYYNGPAFNVHRTTRQDRQINFQWRSDEVPDSAFLKDSMVKLVWPAGVRRYSYRQDPEVPAGNFPDHDNVQIAFNVLDAAEKDLYSFPPGTMPGFTNYQCTDYEFALNPVAEKFGGGFEIWRSKVPGMPHKHFFPRQPRSPLDGAVTKGKLVIKHTGTTRIVEAAIPWEEMPDVKRRRDRGEAIKFSFRVNHNVNNGCMELARDRSVSKVNGSFKVDWKEHWANELEFGFEE